MCLLFNSLRRWIGGMSTMNVSLQLLTPIISVFRKIWRSSPLRQRVAADEFVPWIVPHIEQIIGKSFSHGSRLWLWPIASPLMHVTLQSSFWIGVFINLLSLNSSEWTPWVTVRIARGKIQPSCQPTANVNFIAASLTNLAPIVGIPSPLAELLEEGADLVQH